MLKLADTIAAIALTVAPASAKAQESAFMIDCSTAETAARAAAVLNIDTEGMTEERKTREEISEMMYTLDSLNFTEIVKLSDPEIEDILKSLTTASPAKATIAEKIAIRRLLMENISELQGKIVDEQQGEKRQEVACLKSLLTIFEGLAAKWS